MPHAAEDNHRQNHDRLDQRKAFRRNEALHRRKHAAGDTAEAGPHRKGQQLEVARIDADRLGGDLVLADRLPGTADAGILQAQIDDDDEDGQGHQQEVVFLRPTQRQAENLSRAGKLEIAERHRVDQGNALRAVGDVDRRIQVIHEDTDDFAKAERDDGQVIAAQLQRRRAEQDAEHAGNCRTDRQNHPERPMQSEMRTGEQGIGIGADRVESDVAEIEQPGEADDDV